MRRPGQNDLPCHINVLPSFAVPLGTDKENPPTPLSTVSSCSTVTKPNDPSGTFGGFDVRIDPSAVKYGGETPTEFQPDVHDASLVAVSCQIA